MGTVLSRSGDAGSDHAALAVIHQHGARFSIIPTSLWRALRGPAVYPRPRRRRPCTRPLYVGEAEAASGYIGPGHHEVAASAEPWNERRLRPSRPTWPHRSFDATLETILRRQYRPALNSHEPTRLRGIPAEPDDWQGAAAAPLAEPPAPNLCGLPLLRAVRAKQEWCAPAGFPANGTRATSGERKARPDRADLPQVRCRCRHRVAALAPKVSDESGYHRVQLLPAPNSGPRRCQQFTASRACLDRKKQNFYAWCTAKVRRVVQELLGKKAL